ncbi:MAG: hypothetical protein RMJ51_05785 [Candidatus Calescibacterium sp.]|nr:hypothetical protein [Candidatus Calescibacterium sp.]MDW8195729.1 hypothetical protein [Candidatus Calescibacterium sp.]
MIGNFKDPMETKFVNYFPNYFVPNKAKIANTEKQEEKNKIEDLLIIRGNNEEMENIQQEKVLTPTPKKDIKNNIPVNLFMEETSSIEIRSNKLGLFGPTNLPRSVEEMYINPRYL